MAKYLMSFLVLSLCSFFSLQAQEGVTGEVTIEWNDNSDNEDGFRIEYKLISNSNWIQLDQLGPNITEYGPFSFTPPDTYSFRVYAYNTNGNSEYTNVLSIAFVNDVPNAPSNVLANTVSSSQINLSWNYSNTPPVNGFYIERRSGGQTYQVIDTLDIQANYSDLDLSASTTYYYRIIAFNETGNSEASVEVNATTLSPDEVISQPGTPSGQTNPVQYQSYTYTTSGATSNLGHTIQYQFNWGDGTTSPWSASTSASHSWSNTGTNIITIVARCQIHTNRTNSSDGLTIEVQGPPAAPSISNMSAYSQTQIQLTWPASPNATGYHVYRGNEANFIPDQTGGSNRIGENVQDMDPGIEGIQWIDPDPVLGDPNQNFFYTISAINQGIESDCANVVGEFDYELIITTGTNFNEIALPVHVAGVSNAQELMDVIPSCNSVAVWNSETQAYDQYIPGIQPTNFSIEQGHPYYVNVTENTILTLMGEVSRPTFNLITTTTTNFNEVMLALDKTDITKASELMSDIPNCNSVAFWNASFQGYEQYIPGIPPTDFEVKTGHPYYVNVTSSGSWPEEGTSKSIQGQSIVEESTGSEAPHAVSGHLVLAEGMHIDDMHFSAFIDTRPDEILTEKSSGCLLIDGFWMVQCNSFPSPWESGEVLQVVFETEGGESRTEQTVQLSYSPVDEAGTVSVEMNSVMPIHYALDQNYPNPFNPRTMIPYQVPEETNVRISVFNMVGQEIRQLVNEIKETGSYQIEWNGKDNQNNTVGSGMYLIQMVAGKYKSIRKVCFVQ